MSKFLYPIYKLKTKSYIKWWLYHKKAGGSGVLSEILEGFSFNLENTLNRKFKLFEIEGNSVQDGSPSPDNEVPILSSGDNGSINEKIINKNVWNIDKFKNLYGTNTYETYNNVECLKLAGATQRYNFQGEENTQYTFQFKLIGSTLNNEIGAFSFVYSDGTSDYHGGILTPKTYIFTSKANKTLVKIDWNAWSAGNFIYIDKNSMQLEPGSTATSYVPHEEQDYSIFVQQPMRSIGDVRDCFVKKDGNWYERHYIGEVVLDGSRVWNKSATYSNETYFCGYLNAAVTNIIDGSLTLNNSFQIGIYSSVLDKECMSNNVQLHVRILASRLTENSANGFKQWLSTHNVKAYGRYVTPLDLPCTEEQIEILENPPKTYAGQTNIYSEDETPAHLKIQYYKEG